MYKRKDYNFWSRVLFLMETAIIILVIIIMGLINDLIPRELIPIAKTIALSIFAISFGSVIMCWVKLKGSSETSNHMR